MFYIVLLETNTCMLRLTTCCIDK